MTYFTAIVADQYNIRAILNITYLCLRDSKLEYNEYMQAILVDALYAKRREILIDHRMNTLDLLDVQKMINFFD